MKTDDLVTRSYAILKSLSQNLPNEHELTEKWVSEYNREVGRMERVIGIDLSEFKVQNSNLQKSVATRDRVRGNKYKEGLWCERSILLHKLEALLTYFSFQASSGEKKIGFHPPEK